MPALIAFDHVTDLALFFFVVSLSALDADWEDNSGVILVRRNDGDEDDELRLLTSPLDLDDPEVTDDESPNASLRDDRPLVLEECAMEME